MNESKLFLEVGMSENDSKTLAGGCPAAALLGADQLYLVSGDTVSGDKCPVNASHLHDMMMT